MTNAEEIDRIRRTLVEHKELRRLTNRLRARDVASLLPFDDLEALNGCETIPFVNDHDRIPMLDQLQQRYSEKVVIRYLQRETGEIVIDFVKQ